eukprot:2363095-Pyramimonas_sp.AAC.1
MYTKTTRALGARLGSTLAPGTSIGCAAECGWERLQEKLWITDSLRTARHIIQPLALVDIGPLDEKEQLQHDNE